MVGKLASRSIGALVLLAGAGALFATSNRAAPRSPQKETPSQREISEELARLERDDQHDQNDPTWNETNERKFVLRAKERRDRVVEIVAAGWLASMEDFRHAALLLQHGSGADDYLLAHVLSIPPATEGLPFARFLAAATLDRFLHDLERPQIFSTQSASADPAQLILVEPFDDSMSENLRVVFDLPPLKREPAAKDEKPSKAPSAKELPKLLKAAAAGKPEGVGGADTGAEPPDWLARAREIVAAGAMKSKQDFFLAAQVLEHSTKESDLLQAHVLAMAAALQGHEQGLSVCASTLDRYLLKIGRSPPFGTVVGGATAGSSSLPAAPLHDVVLRAYGLGTAAKKPK